MDTSKYVFLWVALLLICSKVAFGQDVFMVYDVTRTNVTLAWDKNTESDIYMYKLYLYEVVVVNNDFVGKYSPIEVIMHPDTTYRTSLEDSLNTYYKKISFVLTAIDSAFNESGYSNKVTTILCQETGKLYGDLDGDGSITNRDVASLRWQLGTRPANIADPVLKAKYDRYDLDGSGQIDNIDYVVINSLVGNRL